MSWLWWTTGVLLGLIWVHRLFDCALGMRKVPEISGPEWDRTLPKPPRVSIIVPARNEAQHIEEALSSLLKLDYPNYEVIAIDDRSDDATGAIMDRLAAMHPGNADLKVLHLTELPPGWLGKPHAMWRAAQQATGDWLLLTDADVTFRTDALRRAVAYAEEERADHLVLFPTYSQWTPSKKIMLAGFNIMFVFGHRPWKTADPKSRDHMGVGAFNMVRRTVYDAVGGMEPLRMEVIEDMRLGKLVKDAGFRQRNVFGRNLLSLPWGEGAMGIVNNLTKNFFALLHFSVPRCLGACLLLLFLNLLPFVGIWLAHGWAKAGFVAAVASIALLYTGMSFWTPIYPFYFIFHPISTLLLLYTILRSMTHVLRNGGVIWRGTRYSIEELKAGLVKG